MCPLKVRACNNNNPAPTQVRACNEVLGYPPDRILQQASLQTRHFRADGQASDRDFVGDWLVGPVQ